MAYWITRAVLTWVWLWIYVNFSHVYPLSTMVEIAVGTSALYGSLLVALRLTNSAVADNVNRIVPWFLFPAVLVLLVLDGDPWDNAIVYAPLWIYFFEAILYLKTRRKKSVTLVAIVTISFLALFFSLYRIGYVQNLPGATLNGRHVQSRIIRLLGSRDYILSVGIPIEQQTEPMDNWLLINKGLCGLEESNPNRSIIYRRLALVDITFRRNLIDVCQDEVKTGWDPKISYKNERLSFYIEPRRLFVCNGVKLQD